MMHVFGNNLKDEICVSYSLRYFFGVGKYIAKLIINDLNISHSCRIRYLNRDMLNKILKWVDQNKVLIDDSLRQRLLLNNSRSKLVKLNKNTIKNKKCL